MIKSRAFLILLMPLLFSFTVKAAGPTGFSVKTWEENLKASLASGKTDLASFFAFTKIENESLSRAETLDRKNISLARELYAQGKLDLAIKKYSEISKGSDYWLEAIEEKAWAFHLKKDYEKALAQTKTLLAEPLVEVIGSEPFFLQALTQLKICDYPGVFNTDQTFKDSQRKRVASIENLAKTGSSQAVLQVIADVQSFPVTFSQVGIETKEMPRLFYRDLEFQKRLLQVKLTESGIKIITGAGSQNQNLLKAVELLRKTNVSAMDKLKARIKILAGNEDKHNQLMLQKLGLIEVETIQRMHADKNGEPYNYSLGHFSKVNSDNLVFPDDGRPWLDELDKYEVSANACPGNVRRKM